MLTTGWRWYGQRGTICKKPEKRLIKGVEYALANPDAPPSAQHEAWLADKLADGWKYGPEKKPENKEHPCCIPYDQLPIEQRRKDALFKAVVAALTMAA
jgi:hypothetical protein